MSLRHRAPSNAASQTLCYGTPCHTSVAASPYVLARVPHRAVARAPSDARRRRRAAIHFGAVGGVRKRAAPAAGVSCRMMLHARLSARGGAGWTQQRRRRTAEPRAAPRGALRREMLRSLAWDRAAPPTALPSGQRLHLVAISPRAAPSLRTTCSAPRCRYPAKPAARSTRHSAALAPCHVDCARPCGRASARRRSPDAIGTAAPRTAQRAHALSCASATARSAVAAELARSAEPNSYRSTSCT
jgi:hypothetical protein